MSNLILISPTSTNMKNNAKILPFLFLALLSYQVTKAQQVISGKTAKAMPTHIGEMSTYLGDGFGQHRAVTADDINYSEYATVGTSFLTDDWNSGTIYFTLNRKLEDQKFQYDIELNQFLLKGDKELKDLADARIIDAVNVMAFVIDRKTGNNRQFLNSMNAKLTLDGTPLLGFVEVLADGNLTLLRKIETSILKSSYNVALNAGTKQDKIIKKEVYYFKNKDSNNLFKVSKKLNSNLVFFGNHKDKVKAYVKDNKLKFKDEGDLLKITTYYNSL